MAAKSYQELVVWQRAMDLVAEIYKVTAVFPKEEVYGLTNQIRRAAVSVPSNIAEGQGRGVGNEFARHLRIAQGSLQEVETQLMIARRLGYANTVAVTGALELAGEVGRLLRGLRKSLVKCSPTNN
jgi:four helix bundle protein